MKVRKIRTEWAGLSLSHDGSAIVCLQYNDTPCCLYFKSLEQLKQATERKKISVKKWAVAVPRSLCILKPLALPASDLAETAKMIEFELPSLVPLPLEDVVYGAILLDKQDNLLNVLVCILRLNTLNQYLEPYRAIGIEPRRVAPEPLAVQNWVGNAYQEPRLPAVCAVADRHRAIVLTSVDNSLRKAAEITASGSDFSTLAGGILREIADQQEELPPSSREQTKILLAGTEEYVSDMRQRLLSIASDRRAADEVVIVAGPHLSYFEDQEQERDVHGFGYDTVVAAGLFDLAKNSKLPFSNLLGQKSLRRMEQKTVLSRCLFTGSALVVLLLLLWCCLWVMNWRIERKSRKLELMIAPIESVAGGVDKKRQRVRAIQNQLSNRGLITLVFKELYKYTPKNISISRLRFSPKDGGVLIEMQGQADSLQGAYEYTEAMLREAALMNRIEMVKNQVIPRPGGSVAEFKAQSTIRND